MKKLGFALLSGLLISGSAFSGEKPVAPKNPENFAEVQSRIVEHLQKRQEQIQQELTCVKSAKAHEDLQKCRTEAREFHEKMRDDMLNRWCAEGKSHPRCPGKGVSKEVPPLP